MSELKPVKCGCGREAELCRGTTNPPYYWVQCSVCGTGTIGNMKLDPEESVAIWNRAMGWEEPKWCCNLCACYDKQRCYCNLHGIWVASDFGCKAFEPYCEGEDTDWSGNE